VSDRDPCFLSAAELVRAYRRRRLSPLEVTQAVLRRVDALNGRLTAFATVARDAALREARRATAALGRGAALGPLHGVPVSIKDLTPTRGLRTTFGSPLFADHVPAADAVVVERLRAAGAIVVGKTNCSEFGAGANTFNPVFGATRNPWAPALTAGGSSGGAAVALATGMGPLAEGTDLGGSVRIPAAFCGVVGFRTSPGLIPLHPYELAWDTLYVEGPMARTVGDVALMLSVMAGADPRAPLSYPVDAGALARAVRRPDIRGWRVAWTPDLGGLIPVDTEVAGVVEAATATFRRLGARVERAAPDLSATAEVVLATRGLDKVALHAEQVERDRGRISANVVWNVEQGLRLTPRAIARAALLRAELWHRVRAFMAARELLVLPTVAVPPFPVERAYPTEINGVPLADYTRWFFLTYAVTLVGLPAISVPCGFTRAGLPVGLQIVGGHRQEAAVLRAAAAFEAAAPWAHHRPPVLAEA
jgi:amidase